MAIKVLILGVNGFIGSTLSQKILATKDWEIHGLDLSNHKLGACLNHPRFHFKQGDIFSSKDWINEQIKECDVIFPLVAIANPQLYVSNPLLVFELDFEANLGVVRACVEQGKHVVFPSTSEVYGMSPDTPFDEETSSLVLGPIHKQRWIYSCSKQMLDRVIYAYGVRDNFSYTLFRPFDWIGVNMDNLMNPSQGNSRAFAEILGKVIRGEAVQLVDGGAQRRCFTYIDDGIDALIKIVEHREGAARQQIFNVGNPANNYSIRDLASIMIEEVSQYPEMAESAGRTTLVDISSQQYFGTGYQDVSERVPSVERAKKLLGWTPKVDVREAIRLTLNEYVKLKASSGENK